MHVPGTGLLVICVNQPGPAKKLLCVSVQRLAMAQVQQEVSKPVRPWVTCNIQFETSAELACIGRCKSAQRLGCTVRSRDNFDRVSEHLSCSTESYAPCAADVAVSPRVVRLLTAWDVLAHAWIGL